MGRMADNYHVMADGRTPCPPYRRYYWNRDNKAVCLSCGRTYPDHLRCHALDADGNRVKKCIICNEDHD